MCNSNFCSVENCTSNYFGCGVEISPSFQTKLAHALLGWSIL